MSDQMPVSLVILAAGMGSRYGGVKQIDSVGPSGEALIDYSIYDAIQAGFTKLHFIVREEIESDVREFFEGKFPASVEMDFAVQELGDIPEGFQVPEGRRKPWGTAHAVRAARGICKEAFAVINGDDFYGRESFQTIFHFLSSINPSSHDYCMVGYRLADTLSEHGSVSRGLCEVDENGHLLSIEEHKEIEKTKTGAVSRLAGGGSRELSGEEVASMNLFGFTPAFFPQLEEQFRSFLAEHGSEEKSEIYIPWVTNNLLDTGSARLRVLETTSDWFGMTYKEDKPRVMESIRRYIADGVYPESLWS